MPVSLFSVRRKNSIKQFFDMGCSLNFFRPFHFLLLASFEKRKPQRVVFHVGLAYNFSNTIMKEIHSCFLLSLRSAKQKLRKQHMIRAENNKRKKKCLIFFECLWLLKTIDTVIICVLHAFLTLNYEILGKHFVYNTH